MVRALRWPHPTGSESPVVALQRFLNPINCSKP